MTLKLQVSLTKQLLSLLDQQNTVIKNYRINSAKNGIGEIKDSFCTPRGKHVIFEKIGDNLPINSVLVARKPTGEIYNLNLKEKFPNRDWILTRILRLKGTELGFNLGGNCDTLSRFIYIHGCPENSNFSYPLSKGCLRMKNNDILDLFKRVNLDDEVIINAD